MSPPPTPPRTPPQTPPPTPPPTPSQTVGPFFGVALPGSAGPDLVPASTPGAIRIQGQVLDGEAAPVPDALIEIWQAGPGGRYPTLEPAAAGSFHGFGRCRTDPEGAFHFTTLKPGPVPAPDGGLQAPHLVVTVFARGLLRHLVTRLYFPDEEAANAADPVLARVDPERRPLLVARGGEGGALHFDIHLQGELETPFFAI